MTKKIALPIMCFALTTILFAQDKATERLAASTVVLSVKKVGIGIGVNYGRGMITCRTGTDMNGKWSAPATYTLDTAAGKTLVGVLDKISPEGN